MSHARRERLALLAMLAATLLWGGTFVAIRDSVKALTPQALVFGRFAVAAVLFTLVALLRRRAPTAREWQLGVGNGVLMVFAFFLQALGLRTTSAGSSAFLTCAGTLVAAFYAWPLLKQRPSRELFVGLALAFAGSALMSLDGSLRLGRGELITLAGASMYALQIVWVARFAGAIDPLSVTLVQAAVVALCLAPFTGDPRAAFMALSPAGWRDFAYLAVAGSSLAPVFQVFAQQTLPAGRVALLFALEPVFALVFALTLGGERFVMRWWLGAALILVAVVLVEWRAANPSLGKPRE
ncbi:MAG: DMT family transporter [Candidatus Eisenbacteria bacterium]|nr:DMT family transporter [Candidatus Eisenbacteria bacterium]